MKESYEKRLKQLRNKGHKPDKIVKKIEKEGKKRRESKAKFNSFGLSSNNESKRKKPPQGGWV